MPVVRTPYKKRSSADASRWSTSSHAVASFMGGSSDPCRDFVDIFILVRSCDIKIITASFCVAHVDILLAARRGIRHDHQNKLVSNRDQSIMHRLLSHDGVIRRSCPNDGAAENDSISESCGQIPYNSAGPSHLSSHLRGHREDAHNPE